MLTAGEKLRAQRLMGEHERSYEAIAHKLNKTADDVRRAMRPQIRMRSKLARQRDEAVVDDGKPFGMIAAGLSQPGRDAAVPSRILVERERAMSAPLSITAELMGDPKPGRSALDKRGRYAGSL